MESLPAEPPGKPQSRGHLVVEMLIFLTHQKLHLPPRGCWVTAAQGQAGVPLHQGLACKPNHYCVWSQSPQPAPTPNSTPALSTAGPPTKCRGQQRLGLLSVRPATSLSKRDLSSGEGSELSRAHSPFVTRVPHSLFSLTGNRLNSRVFFSATTRWGVGEEGMAQ